LGGFLERFLVQMGKSHSKLVIFPLMCDILVRRCMMRCCVEE
jgi:hypothetical protein